MVNINFLSNFIINFCHDEIHYYSFSFFTLLDFCTLAITFYFINAHLILVSSFTFSFSSSVKLAIILDEDKIGLSK